MTKRLNKTQRALLLNIISDINSEEAMSIGDLLDKHTFSPGAKDLFLLDHPIWSAGENMPGYLPESPYCLFLTRRAARGYCRSLEREAGRGAGGYVTDWMPTTLREVLS